MTPDELAFLEAALDRGTRYLEYGAGNSTRLAASRPNLAVIRSVESDPSFVEANVLSLPAVADAQASGRLRFLFANIGPTREWGHPRDQSRYHLWPGYALAPYLERSDWDLVLIDGRFRVACALLAAFECAPSTVILMHDFTWRPEYAICLEYLTCVKTVDTLIQLRRRADFDVGRAQRLLKHYLYEEADQPPASGWTRGLRMVQRRSRRLLGGRA